MGTVADRGHYHVGADHLHLHHHLWPDAGNLSHYQHGPHPHGGDAGQGMGRHGAELFEVPVCPGFPGVPHHGVRGDLCGAGAGDCRKRRHQRGHLDVHGLHGAAVLHPVQDGEPV